MPRESTYTDALAQEICDLLCTGETLEGMCRRLEYLPSTWAVIRWRKAHPEFEAAYRVARRIGWDHIAADTLEIADSANADNVQVAKLQIETRLKLLAKWDPKRYGDKLELGSDAKRPLIINIRKFTDA